MLGQMNMLLGSDARGFRIAPADGFQDRQVLAFHTTSVN
jgi:hypothetical protein